MNAGGTFSVSKSSEIDSAPGGCASHPAPPCKRQTQLVPITLFGKKMKQPPEKLIASAPEGTVWYGGPVDRSKLSLRVIGDDLDPDEVTRLLGHPPTRIRRKGDAMTDSGSVRAPFSSWCLQAPVSTEADVDAQVEWLFSRLTSDLSIWKDLSSRSKVDLYGGLFLEAENRGFSLSPKTLGEIAKRGVSLGFEIYAP